MADEREDERMVTECPLCKEERVFLRVVEAHRQIEYPTYVGGTGHLWIKKTSHPTAYCPVCNIVIYVGPTPEEVEQEFRTRRKQRQEESGEETDADPVIEELKKIGH